VYIASLKLATCLHAGFLFDLLFDPEDGGVMFLRNVADSQLTTRRYIPEDSILLNHRCENHKSYIKKIRSGGVQLLHAARQTNRRTDTARTIVRTSIGNENR
jgi:hypothetical protein